MPYPYESLKSGDQEIRVLLILPSPDPDEEIKCMLHHQSLKNINIPYIALSYVWGQLPAVDHIAINTHKVAVQPNLLSALKAWRDKQGVVTVWADAVCINQADIPERNAQVALMGTIYRNATRVWMWLGAPSQETDMAFDFCAEMVQRFDKLGKSTSIDESQRALSFLYETAYDARWKALQSLLRMEYWVRLWITQEVILASEAVVLCGSKAILWRRLAVILQMLATFPVTGEVSRAAGDTIKRSLTAYPVQMARLTDRRCQGQELAVYEGLLLSRSRRCSEPRDRVYGVVGIVRGNDITPDYSKSILEVFRESVIESLRVDKSANVLTGCKGIRDGSVTWPVWKPEEWPSWVPEWRIESQEAEHLLPSFKHPGATQYKEFHAGGVEFPGYKLAGNGRILILKAIVVDVVVRGRLEYPTSRNKDMKQEFKALWSGWESSRDRGHPYGGQTEQWDAFARTTVAGKLQVSEDEEDETKTEDWTAWWEHFMDWTGYHKAGPTKGRQVNMAVGMRMITGRLAVPQFFTTTKGYMGRGPSDTREGDIIAVLLGADVPFVLRPVPGCEQRYSLIGECYLDGIMNGEAIRWWKEGKTAVQRIALV